MSKQVNQSDNGRGRPQASDHYDIIGVRRAIAGASAAMLIVVTGVIVIGRLSGLEARILLQASLDSIRFLSSAVMAASATIIALMLTLLGISYNADTELKPVHYRRVRQIALVDTVTLVAATMLLLLITIPLEETQSIPSRWYVTIYYVVLLFSATIGGLLVAVVLMLYGAILDLIDIIEPAGDSKLVVDTDDSGDAQ